MKQWYLKKGGWHLAICTVTILAALLFIGCEGDTGPPGPAGKDGASGTVAPGGALPATAETCSICHGEGKIADIGVAHPDDPAFLGEQVIISNVTLNNTAGADDGLAVVSFHMETLDGTPVDNIDGQPLDVDMFRFIMADLVPAGTATQWGTWDTDYWERWVYERTPGTTGYPQGTLDISDAANGNYTYTFATTFGSATALADAPDYNVNHVQRLFVRFDGRDDPNITQRTVAFLDFNIPAVGNQATALDPQRQFVTAEACEKCHSPNWERAAHASGYRDIRACVLCHSPLGFDTLGDEDRGQFMQDTDAYASVFFHKIHAAIDIPFWTAEGRIGGEGYSAVSFPQHDADDHLRDCVICHVDLTNGGEGGGLGSQAFQIDQWKSHPTAEICSSCHFPGSEIGDVDIVAGTGHGGGAQPDNTGCSFCHPDSSGGLGRSIDNAHDVTPHVADPAIQNDQDYATDRIPEFDVTITMDPPANGTNYVVGEAPVVRVTLTNHSDGSAVDPAIYTTPQDEPGNPGGGLADAFLQVYGPRARPFPVMATDTTTDPNWSGDPGDIEDEHELFINTDPLAMPDSSGFAYQLLPVTADMEAGTYMVRFEGGDYSAASGTDFITHSTAVITFQVKTATEEFRVSGEACLNCHGTTRMHEAGAHPHNAAFATDECLACHHDTGHDIGERVHGVPIANRVHAVHSANIGGDIIALLGGNPASRDWTHVTFPREIQNCNTCHNSQFDDDPLSEDFNTFEGTYKTLPYMMPCSGCHSGESNDFQGDLPVVPGVTDHMIQNGGPWFPK